MVATAAVVHNVSAKKKEQDSKESKEASAPEVSPEGTPEPAEKDEPREGPRAGDAAKHDPGTPGSGGKRHKKDKTPPPLPEGKGIWKLQPRAAAFMLHIRTQMFVAGLIAGNFACNIIDKWIDPTGELYPTVFFVFETFFNVMFTFELVINMYAFWLCGFWKSGWNIFDFLVVTIGLLTMFNVPLPGPFSLLRMMRAFRVFRLFKRVKSLNKIMVSLAKALPGVANAFFILLLVMSIYAIIAVDLFMDYGKGGVYINAKGNEVALMTSRNQEYGYEYFGNFGKSLYTMFQVLTGESWSEAVARPLLHSNNTVDAFGVAFFFVSFVIVNGVVLINVVVAVLLEKMVDDPNEGKAKEEEAEEDLSSEEEEEDEEAHDQNGQTGPPEDAAGRAEESKLCENGDTQARKDVPTLVVNSLTQPSDRVAHLKADLDTMKTDMANIQSSLSTILQLMDIQLKASVPPSPSTPKSVPLPEGGPRDIGQVEADDKGKEPPDATAAVELPGALS